MNDVQIKNKTELDDGWKFTVGVDGSEFEVEVEKKYWEKLTNGEEEPESLVKRSFKFLLAREPKESILKSFNLKVISNYFPEYEGKIQEITG